MSEPASPILPSSPSLLIVDDDRALLASLVRVFEREGLNVLQASGGQEALETLRRERVGVCLTDLMMPKMSGLDLLRAAKTVSPETEFILMTAFGTVETAVEAMKEGALDFVTKPAKRIHIVRSVRRALDQQTLIAENQALRAQLSESRAERSIIGNSLPMRQLMDMVRQVAPSSATVLLTGQSGTGKELVARALHARSDRAGRPFIAVNCAALPATILEAELFGHERGAFTGATGLRKGRFELADRGTLLLDEVGELDAPTQVKLLRVLQEGEFERLGGTRTLRVDVRIIAATNKDLDLEVREGRFREDLYYRLNVINVHLPPLGERGEDIALLAHHFLRRYADKNNKMLRGIHPDALEALTRWSWPGNVRELENAVERAVVLCRGDVLTVEDLPPQIHAAEGDRRMLSIPIGTPLDTIERMVIQETLQATKGDKKLAAQLLGIATRTIYRKI